MSEITFKITGEPADVLAAIEAVEDACGVDSDEHVFGACAVEVVVQLDDATRAAL